MECPSLVVLEPQDLKAPLVQVLLDLKAPLVQADHKDLSEPLVLPAQLVWVQLDLKEPLDLQVALLDPQVPLALQDLPVPLAHKAPLASQALERTL
jgi:hypothetical protein